MDKPNIVVTYTASPEQQAFLLELLGDVASLTFLSELAPEQREKALEEATILLSWNFPREIQPLDYPRLRRVLFIQLLSAGADHMPFADLPPRIIVASNPGAYAAPMAEHVLAMTLALAKHLLVQHQKLKEGEFDQFIPNRMLSGMTAGILGMEGSGVLQPGSCAPLACASTPSIPAGPVRSQRTFSGRCTISNQCYARAMWWWSAYPSPRQREGLSGNRSLRG